MDILTNLTYESIDAMSLEEVENLSAGDMSILRLVYSSDRLKERRIEAIKKDSEFKMFINFYDFDEKEENIFANLFNSANKEIRGEFFDSYERLSMVMDNITQIEIFVNDSESVEYVDHLINQSDNIINYSQERIEKLLVPVPEMFEEILVDNRMRIGELIDIQAEFEEVHKGFSRQREIIKKVIKDRNPALSIDASRDNKAKTRDIELSQ